MRNSAQLRLGFRITAAALLSYAACRALGFSHSYPAVITSIVVMQASVGASLKAMLDRLSGSLGGAAWGVAVLAWVHPSDDLALGAVLACALAPLAFLAAFRPAYRAAPVTAAILLLTPSGTIGPLAPAIERVLEIGIGSVVAFAVTLWILPVRAHTVLGGAAGRAAASMGDLAAALAEALAGKADAEAIQRAHDAIRSALDAVEDAAAEAIRERATHLTTAPDPKPVARTLRRLRSDLVSIGRIVAQPTESLAAPELAGEALRAAAAFLHASGKAIAREQAAPAIQPVEAALEAYSAAVTAMRRAGRTRELPDEAIGRIFGLGFSFEQLHRNLIDLADRAAELAP